LALIKLILYIASISINIFFITYLLKNPFSPLSFKGSSLGISIGIPILFLSIY